MKKLEYLAKKYLDRTLTRNEWDELLELINKAKDSGDVDSIFRNEWIKKDQSFVINDIQWSEILALDKVKRRTRKKTIFILPVWQWVAAAAAVVVIIFVAVWGITEKDNQYIVYETGFGEVENIRLQDGSDVVLNANSILTWDRTWNRTGVRNVELVGEAYFDVSHVESKVDQCPERMPFKVITADLVVNVLGTSFNVCSRRDETDVFLERGLVTLELASSILSDENQKKTTEGDLPRFGSKLKEVKMQPGEFVSFSYKTNKLTTKEDEHSEELVEWKEGTLTYRKLEFGMILSELEDIYGVHFEIKDPKLIKRKVSLALPFENWDIVQGLIEVTLNLEMRRDNNIIKITSK